MLQNKKSRIAVVTGGGGFGIGSGIAIALARTGLYKKIYVHYGRSLKYRRVYKQVTQETETEFVFVKANFGTKAGPEKAASEIIADLNGDKIDQISLVAAVTYQGDFFEYEYEDWHKALDMNTISGVMLLKYLVKDHMSDEMPNIAIISTNHADGNGASGAHPLYALTKWAMRGLMGTIVRRFGNHGLRQGVKTRIDDSGRIVQTSKVDPIRVNVVSPGWTMSQRQWDEHLKWLEDRAAGVKMKDRRGVNLCAVASEMPTGLINNPDDIGRTVVFLDSMPTMNGAFIEMTNGISCVFAGTVEQLEF